jgi:hypothetical protein
MAAIGPSIDARYVGDAPDDGVEVGRRKRGLAVHRPQGATGRPTNVLL